MKTLFQYLSLGRKLVLMHKLGGIIKTEEAERKKLIMKVPTVSMIVIILTILIMTMIA